MPNKIFYKRVTLCPNAWWEKDKFYEVKYFCGKAYILDEEKDIFFIRDDLTYLKKNFEKIVK